MEPTAYEIHELRCKFFDKLETEHGSPKGWYNLTIIISLM